MIACVKSAIFALCDAVISESVHNTIKITFVLYCFCLLCDAEHNLLATAKFLVGQAISFKNNRPYYAKLPTVSINTVH